MATNFPLAPSIGTIHPNPAVAGMPQYVWDGVVWKTTTPTDSSGHVLKSGDTMTGALALSGDPTAALEAAPKRYVDAVRTYAAPFDAMAYNGLQVNGGFEVSQEIGFNVGTAVDGTYFCDGWRISFNGTMGVTGAAASSTFLASIGFYNYASVSPSAAQTTLTGSNHTMISTMIEASRMRRLRWGTSSAQPITIGFWSIHTRPGVYSVATINIPAANRYYVTTYTHAAADTPQYNVITVPGCVDGAWVTDNTSWGQIAFVMASGPTLIAPAANVWGIGGFIAAPGQVNGVAATSDNFRIAGVVVLPGIYAPTAQQSSLIMRPFDQELLLCKRYLEMWVPDGTTLGVGQCINVTGGRITIPYAVTKRAIPTITMSAAATFGMTDAAGNTVVCLTALLESASNRNMFITLAGASGFLAGDAFIGLLATSDCFIKADARL